MQAAKPTHPAAKPDGDIDHSAVRHGNSAEAEHMRHGGRENISFRHMQLDAPGRSSCLRVSATQDRRLYITAVQNQLYSRKGRTLLPLGEEQRHSFFIFYKALGHNCTAIRGLLNHPGDFQETGQVILQHICLLLLHAAIVEAARFVEIAWAASWGICLRLIIPSGLS